MNLDELGCFKNIGVYIDTSKGASATNDGLEARIRPESGNAHLIRQSFFQVTFEVKEHKRITGGISTQVGNNEGSVLVGLRTPNILGRGEKVQIEYSRGSKRTSNFNLSFIKPFSGKNRPR